MPKFKKPYNSKIISVILSMLFCVNSTLYASGASSLRLPLNNIDEKRTGLVLNRAIEECIDRPLSPEEALQYLDAQEEILVLDPSDTEKSWLSSVDRVNRDLVSKGRVVILKLKEPVRFKPEDERRDHVLVLAQTGGGELMTRRGFIERALKLGAGITAMTAMPGWLRGRAVDKNRIGGETGDFSPAKVIDSLAGSGFRYENIIEWPRDNNKLIDVLRDLRNIGEEKKIIRWQWLKSGESYSFKKWDSGAETADLSANADDLIFRFAISGTPYVQYKIIFEDNQGQRIEVFSTEHLTTLYAEQYWLVKLDNDLRSRNSSFNWQKVKPPRFEAVSSKGDLFIKHMEILDVKDVRARGISIGLFYHTDSIPGNDFYPHEGLTGKAIPGGRAPASVLSFSSLIYRDPYQMLELWKKLLPGQVPHEVLEIHLPGGTLGKAGVDEAYLNNLRKMAAERKARILAGEKIDKGALQKSTGASVFKRIINREFDSYFVKRAQAAKEYGKPVMLRFFHEMMGGWYPWSIWSEGDIEDFINAWKHIVKIYRKYGATNVAFGLSPHTYEPDYLPQTRKFQIVDHILWRLLNDSEGPFVDFVGIDAYSYPPGGGYFNELTTECRETVGKYGIPVIMGEMSSAMSTDDKYRFWNYLRTDLKNGMFSSPLLTSIVIFSIAKDENGWKDFHPPTDTMEEYERDTFFGANTFKDFPWRGGDKKEGILEPVLPRGITSIANWQADENSLQRFTMLPGSSVEECFWVTWGSGWRGHGFQVFVFELNSANYSDFELSMPLEIHEGEFYLILEDSAGYPVGNQIRLKSSDLRKYITDGQLVMPLNKVVQYGVFDTGRFSWEQLMQVKIELLGERGKILRGRPEIRKIKDTAVDVREGEQGATGETADLKQNYPNPFGSEGTNIPYILNRPAGGARIRILNSQGRLVRTFDKIDKSAGSHVINWNGIDKDGVPVTSGQYLIELIAKDSDGKAIRKVIKSIKLSAILGVGINILPESAGDFEFEIMRDGEKVIATAETIVGRDAGYDKGRDGLGDGFHRGASEVLGTILKRYQGVIIQELGCSSTDISFYCGREEASASMLSQSDLSALSLQKEERIKVRVESKRELSDDILLHIMKDIVTIFNNEWYALGMLGRLISSKDGIGKYIQKFKEMAINFKNSPTQLIRKIPLKSTMSGS